MSSMRSASSSTRYSRPASLAYGDRKWSSRRPGVATMTSTPLRNACSCGPMPTPPKTAAAVIGVCTARPSRSSAICAASSRVGVSTSARVVPRGRPISLCRIGRRNAAVLPLPVMAHASRSRPSSAGGMASDWIGRRPGEAELLEALEQIGMEIEGAERHDAALVDDRPSSHGRCARNEWGPGGMPAPPDQTGLQDSRNRAFLVLSRRMIADLPIRFPRATLLVAAVLTIGLGLFAARFSVDSAVDRLLPEGDADGALLRGRAARVRQRGGRRRRDLRRRRLRPGDAGPHRSSVHARSRPCRASRKWPA